MGVNDEVRVKNLMSRLVIPPARPAMGQATRVPNTQYVGVEDKVERVIGIVEEEAIGEPKSRFLPVTHVRIRPLVTAYRRTL